MKDIKAIFCDGSIIVGGVKRSAGKYSKILLNAFTDKKGEYIIEKRLEKEYAAIAKALEFLLCPDILIEVSDIAENLINCISAIKVLFPFNVSDEIQNVTELFSDKNIHDVNILKQSRTERTDNPHELCSKYPELSDAQFVIHTVEIESEIKDCLLFFENISHDVSKAYSEMKEIADTYSEMQKHYEDDLLPVAVDLLNNWNVSALKTRYITVLSKKGKKTLGREMIFTSYREIIVTIITGLLGAIPDLILAIPEIIMAIVKTFADYDWASIGTNIMTGFKDGVSYFYDNFYTSFINL